MKSERGEPARPRTPSRVGNGGAAARESGFSAEDRLAGQSQPAGAAGVSLVGRIAALGAIALAALAVALLVFGGNDGEKYTFLFETGGQLVPGNQVLVGGRPIGSIDSIELTDDGQAAVKTTLREPLHEGTTAVIRLSSLSGVANRYVSLTMGPNNAPLIPPGTTITGEDTTAPVDIDQLLNTFRKPERRALKKFIKGNATVYRDKGRLANRAYKFLNPALTTSERLFREISGDSVALERFLVSGSQVFGALADRRGDLSALIGNANRTLQAIANRNRDLDRSLLALPGALRQGSTTLVNLRATLDDLDPLVAAAKPATEDLAPFLRRLRKVADRSVPVFSDLSDVVKKPGANNDLADTLAELPRTRRAAGRGLPAAITAMDVTQDDVQLLRPYSPDLLAWIAKFGQASAYYDGNGNYARAQPAAANIFAYNSGSLDPQYDSPQFPVSGAPPYFLNPATRCPGGASAPAPDGSNPFDDYGRLAGDCNMGQVPPGP